MWGEQGQCVLKPKSRGSGIMVSDFIDKHNGYLRLTDEEYTQAVDKVDGCKRKHVLSLSMEKNMKDIGLQKSFYLSWKMLSKLLISNIVRKKIQSMFCL